MVVNKRSDLKNTDKKLKKKKFNLGIDGKRIPVLEKLIKEQRKKADAIGDQLLKGKTTSGGRINKKKQIEMMEEQKNYNVRAWENEQVLKRIKKKLLDIKKDKKGRKKLSLSDYNIDILWSSDKKKMESKKTDSPWVWVDISSDAKAGVPGHGPTMHVMRSKPSLNIKNNITKQNIVKDHKRKKKALVGLKSKDVESLKKCITIALRMRPSSPKKKKKKKVAGVSGGMPSDPEIHLKEATPELSEDIETSSARKKREEQLYEGGSARWNVEGESSDKVVSSKKSKKILPKKNRVLKEKDASFLTRKEKRKNLIQKRRIFLNRIKKLSVKDLRKCLVKKVSVVSEEQLRTERIDKEIERIRKNLSSSTDSSSSSELFQPKIYDWTAGRADDYTIKKRQSSMPVWDDILPNYEISKDARQLLNNPPKHFVYGKKENINRSNRKSWGSQGNNIYQIIHTNRIPLDLIKPTEIKEVNFIYGKTKRKRNENIISKDDVIRAYKDNYYGNIINDFTRREIRFADSQAQHFAYDNKIDVSLLYPISYLKNKMNWKKNMTNLQRKKILEKNQELMRQWNTKGITLKDLKEHLNNKPKYNLTKIEQLINTVKNIGRGKQNIDQQKIIEKGIKKTMAKIIRIKNEKDNNIKRIAQNLDIDPENTEELVTKFNQLKDALAILREKMVYIPIISPKKTKLLEPWDI